MSDGTVQLARQGWKHTFELHTCQHCQRIVLRQDQIEQEVGDDGYVTRASEGFIRLPHTRSEVLQAARDGCPVFAGVRKEKLKYTRSKMLWILLKYLWASKFERKRMKDYRRDWKGVGSLSSAFSCKESRLFDVVLENVLGLHFYLMLTSRQNGIEIYHFLRRVHKYNMDHSIVPQIPSGKYLLWERVCISKKKPTDLLSQDSICTKSEFQAFTKNNVASDQNIAMIKQLLDECRSKHPSCSMPTTDFVPTRLLELSIDFKVRLVETSHMSSKCHTWASLSYVWGGEQPWKTTLDRLDRYHDEIPVSDLPLTITDAIYVCLALGVSHLWVDSLCIVQDDGGDKANELPTMASIYRNAIFTISAACTRRSKDGFLYHRPIYYKEFPPTGLQYRTSDGRQEVAVVLAELGLPDEIPDPIEERSWTFQERLLSQRILSYSSREFVWNCNYHLRQGQKWEWWDRKVESFSASMVTYPLDKLVSLSAVASVFHEQNEDCKTYLAGLWKEQLPNGLSWSVPERTPPRRRPDEYVAPSWSWASLNGPIAYGHYYPSKDPHDKEDIEILHANATPTLPNAPFGAVSDGTLVIRAKCKDYEIKIDTEAWDKWKSGENHDIALTFDDHPLSIRPDADEDCWSLTYKTGLNVLLLKLGSRAGIVLLKVKEDTYRRVAWYEMTRFYAPDGEILLDTVVGFAMQTVTII